ncbi:DUF6602 domain-containing protein [Kluyvera intermedia]|uniref:DUF6602 domain-containing protein n=1 Tax=Kluyvera intermedia TaxID=61648 RepID=A0ABX6DQD1_KLUIN|nr:DUF6602 domain-containing protein [Kluyvera intermedia]QGH30804.1 hypothetical protein GHC21_14465 [Kluyvera intermedia]QGH39786.1 hypothetical protein GHC38_14465 [Kluyvera intermedia]
MIVKNQYQALLRSKVQSAMAQAKAAAGFSHQGVKGTVLEILVSQLFRPLLPADIGMGTGQIIDSYTGKMSNQIDIILYDKAILPPIIFDANTGLFPIESVLYTIEVKTTLNSKELTTAHESAKTIRQDFSYRPGLKDINNNELNHSIEKAISVVFALKSDLKKDGISEAERYKKVFKENNRFISAICVADREYCYEDRGYWRSTRDTGDYDEILLFISGISNTYKRISNSRMQPLLGHYIAPEHYTQTLTPAEDMPELVVKCSSCRNEVSIICDFGNQNKTIIGSIKHHIPCNCGGELLSDNGVYTIINGRLRKIEANNNGYSTVIQP